MEEESKAALVLGGGGIHGFAFIGGLRYLEKNYRSNPARPVRDQFGHVIGTSIGALIGLMVVLGYTVQEMEEECLRFDFDTLAEELKSLDALKLTQKYGLNTGDLLSDQIKQIIRRKTKNGNITLLEMYNDWSNQTRFDAIAVNVNQSKSVALNHLTEPSLPVHKAIRMSVSVPLLFYPVKHDGHYYIDGGVLSNFPVHFVAPEECCKRIVGFRIVPESTSDVSTFQSYITSIVYSVLTEMENIKLAREVTPGSNTRVVVDIKLTPKAPSAFQFSISEENKKKLIKLGYHQTAGVLGSDKGR